MQFKKVKIKLSGLGPIMFDRFIDHSKEKRPPEQKFYLGKDNLVVFPAENIRQFLVSIKPPAGCCVKFEEKKGKVYAKALDARLQINPALIPFQDDNGKIFYKDFDGDQFDVFVASPKDAKGQKMEKISRPFLNMPWYLNFEIILFENHLIDENKLRNYFERGGIDVCLGNGRTRFGKFQVDEWEIIEDRSS